MAWRCPCGALNDRAMCEECGRARTPSHVAILAEPKVYEVRDPAPPEMAAAVAAHYATVLTGTRGTPASRAAHRAWLAEMDRRFPGIGWDEEVLAWDRWVTTRYSAGSGRVDTQGMPRRRSPASPGVSAFGVRDGAVQPAELALAADPEEPAWVRGEDA